MALTWDRLLAPTIAAGYVIAAAVYAPSYGMIIAVALAAAFPVALIWWPDYCGGSWAKRKKTVLYTYDEPGPAGPPIRDSHPALVSFMGWFFLVGLPPLVYWLANR
jgi:hypothetical protein